MKIQYRSVLLFRDQLCFTPITHPTHPPAYNLSITRVYGGIALRLGNLAYHPQLLASALPWGLYKLSELCNLIWTLLVTTDNYQPADAVPKLTTFSFKIAEGSFYWDRSYFCSLPIGVAINNFHLLRQQPGFLPLVFDGCKTERFLMVFNFCLSRSVIRIPGQPVHARLLDQFELFFPSLFLSPSFLDWAQL